MFPWNPSTRKVPRSKPPRKELHSRLVLEPLESRTLLSICTVDRLTDNNPAGGGEGGNGTGDLRWCVIESLFQADTIAFGVTGTINLVGVLPPLTRGVSIEGPGADLMSLRRYTGGNYKIFTVAAGVTATVSGLTISNGNGTDGSGIYNGGTLTLSNSVVSGNVNSDSGNSFGGGIYNQGTLTLSNSTVSGNLVIAPYGSGSYGGGIYNAGTLTVSDSTVSGNTVNNTGGLGNYGAGIFNSSSGTSTVSNSTISNNTNDGGYGGGILNDYGALTVTNSTISGNSVLNYGYGGGIDNNRVMTTRNTIIAGNTAPNGPDVNGNLGSQGHDLVGNPLDMTGWVDTDLLHVNPGLGPLQDNGGPTQTMALLPDSPALNAGAPDQLDVPDQRGVARSGGVNIGAYQASATAFVLSAPAKVTVGLPFDLTVTAVDPFGQAAVGYIGTVTFTTSDPDPGVVLPADYTFTTANAGMHTFTDTGLGETTLITRGQQTVTATDTADGSITGSANVKVKHLRRHDENGGVLAGLEDAAMDRFFASLREADFRSEVLSPDHRHAGTGSWEPDLFS